MERAFGMDIPRTMEEACDPRRMVLLVYDMQLGIASQLPHGPEVTARVGRFYLRLVREASACSSAATRRFPKS
ncbi:MAG TPA: hypothetical protein VI055_02415 [Rubrobacter sp.]|jgi:hypothetical protein